MKRDQFLFFIKKNGIIFSSSLMIILIVFNMGIIVYNNYILKKNKELKAQIDLVKKYNDDIWSELVRNLDIGVRGYAVTKDTVLLQPYYQSIREQDPFINRLEKILKEQNYKDLVELETVKEGVKAYTKVATQMVELIDQDLQDSLSTEVKKDQGKALWTSYSSFTNKLYAYEDQLAQEAEARYSLAMSRTIYAQLFLLILGVPSLIFTISKLLKDGRQRRQLFLDLETNNRKFIFDPGTPITASNEKELINNSIINFQKAASFINQISKGDYKVDWAELSESNKSLNQTNLAGELIQMREKMKSIKEEDEKRLWSTEGIAKFSEIIRSNQDDLKALGDEIVGFVVKYLGAQQGSLFLLNEEGQCLDMISCFAFDRKKFIEKQILIGEGLVGQTYLEKESNFYIDIPEGYTSISSGLGDGSPLCLLIVPMKYNRKVEAVIEVASFKELDRYKLEWVEKIGEITASTLLSVKTSSKTKAMLEEFKVQSEKMKFQEEELRQNIEELEATQEEMRRKEVELEKRQEQLSVMLKLNR